MTDIIDFEMQLGAFVNEQYQAREGLETDTFGDRLTYLGHYHKPQVVPDTHVRYIGSPYQGDLTMKLYDGSLKDLQHTSRIVLKAAIYLYTPLRFSSVPACRTRTE